MDKRVLHIIANPLLSGSGIVFLGTFSANILSYVFNLFMGRLLSVQDYGLLISLFSFFSLFGIFRGSLTKVFSRYSATYHAQKDERFLKNLIVAGGKLSFIIGIALFLILLLLSFFIMKFLHIQYFLHLLIILSAILFSILIALPQGMIQGLLKFRLLAFFSALPALIKTVSGLLLVVFGFGVSGALFSVLLSVLVPLILFFLILPRIMGKNILKKDRQAINERQLQKEYLDYGIKFFVAALGMSLLANTDVLLARYFLEELASGQYAALTIMGKAIYYITAPIGLVFFPLIAYKKAKKEKLLNTILFAAGLIMLISIPMSFVYFVFPRVVLSIFFPSAEYASLRSYLGPFSLYIFLFSLVTLFNSFFLSIGKTGIYKITLAGGFAQIILLVLFHASFHQIIGVLFLTIFIILVSFMIYYIKFAQDRKLFLEKKQILETTTL